MLRFLLKFIIPHKKVKQETFFYFFVLRREKTIWSRTSSKRLLDQFTKLFHMINLLEVLPISVFFAKRRLPV